MVQGLKGAVGVLGKDKCGDVRKSLSGRELKFRGRNQKHRNLGKKFEFKNKGFVVVEVNFDGFHGSTSFQKINGEECRGFPVKVKKDLERC